MATAYSGNNSGQFSGAGDLSAYTVNQPVSIASGAVGQRENKALTAAAVTITVPTGATLCMITPPTTSTNAKTLKGVAGDTGIPMAPALPAMIPIVSGTVSFVILSAGAETVILDWF